jgi:prepilin-type processing-associated H-X9-DG protein
MTPSKGKPVSLLAVVAGLFVVTAVFFFWPLSERTDDHSLTRGCVNNLKQIHAFALAYLQKHGEWPIAKGEHPQAHESLNELIRAEADGMHPSLFRCEAGEAERAVVDARHRFFLEEKNLSYAWLARPLEKSTKVRPLASDKYVEGFHDGEGAHEGHKGGMNVLMTDGSIRFVKTSDLPAGTLLPDGLTR